MIDALGGVSCNGANPAREHSFNPMAKTSPAEWLFRSMSAIAALQFLEGDTPLEDMLVDARPALDGLYSGDLKLTEDLAALATELLGALVKLEAPDPPAILRAYAANTLTSNPDGSARKLKRLLGSVLDPEEPGRFRVEEGLRAFRQFCFGLKNGAALTTPEDWHPGNIKELSTLLTPFLQSIGRLPTPDGDDDY